MADVCVRPYRRGEEDWVAQAHRRAYAEEYGWGSDFSDYAARVALDFAAKPPNAREALWVAELDGVLIGCVMLCETQEHATGQLRLFLVERSYRRRGAGSALLRTLLDKADECGYEKLMLWTADPLTDAIGQYTRLGFYETLRQPNTTWSLSGSTVYEIMMELDLK